MTKKENNNIIKEKEKIMKLTAENVEVIFKDCLFKNSEPVENCVKAEGIANTFGFNPKRLKQHKDRIYDMLKQLPSSFQKESGGGMTFLNACDDKDGNQWTGLHSIIEQLVVLGIAIDKAKYCLPRGIWGALPGAMPYFVVK